MYSNLVKTCLVLGVKKPSQEHDIIKNLDLAKKLDNIIFLDLSIFAQQFA